MSIEKYKEFLKNKTVEFNCEGLEVESLNDKLFDWQSDITKWALKKGRSLKR